MTGRAIETSPKRYARIAGGFYLVTFAAGILALASDGAMVAANLIAAASYVAVTVMLYYVFRPVSTSLSGLAAFISLAGLAWGTLSMFDLAPAVINNLVFFGFYCLLIGYLTIGSTFLPRILGALMAFGGVGWLTFASPQLAERLSPYNFFPGIVGEGVLTMWLVVKGLDAAKWKEQAGSDPSAVDP